MVALNVLCHSEHILRVHFGIDGVILSHQLLYREGTQHPACTARQTFDECIQRHSWKLTITRTEKKEKSTPSCVMTGASAPRSSPRLITTITYAHSRSKACSSTCMQLDTEIETCVERKCTHARRLSVLVTLPCRSYWDTPSQQGKSDTE